MTHVFDRKQLYAMVWAEPTRTIAKRLGISDVGLAKACHRANIPVPERGYWAKRQHGKAPAKTPLPKCRTAPAQVAITPQRPKPTPSAAAQAALAAAPPPPLAVPADLHRPHAIVRTWIEDNDRLRREYRRNDWGLSQLLDLAEPLQQRRLRLYSALFTALERRGFTLEAGARPDVFVVAKQGDEAIEFRIYERQRKVRRPLTVEERRQSWNRGKSETTTLQAAGDLTLKVKTYTRGAMAEDYRDQTAPLEGQLPGILVAFDAGIAELKAWRAERAIEAQRRADIAARAARRAEHARQAAERRQRLLAVAAAWREAQTLRAFIAAAKASPQAQREGFEAWAAWAAGEAEALDPLVGEALDLTLPPAFVED